MPPAPAAAAAPAAIPIPSLSVSAPSMAQSETGFTASADDVISDILSDIASPTGDVQNSFAPTSAIASAPDNFFQSAAGIFGDGILGSRDGELPGWVIPVAGVVIAGGLYWWFVGRK